MIIYTYIHRCIRVCVSVGEEGGRGMCVKECECVCACCITSVHILLLFAYGASAVNKHI